MSYGQFACQNPLPRREIRFSLIITQSVLTHQSKKTCSKYLHKLHKQPVTYLPGEMAHHAGECNKISLKPVILHTPQENAFLLLCNGRSRVLAGLPTGLDFTGPTRPGFPTYHIPKSPCVCFGASSHSKPQRSHDGSGSPGCHSALGKGSVPFSSPSTDGVSKAFASCCGLGALQCARRARRE